MRKARQGASTVFDRRPARKTAMLSYQELAGGLAAEMANQVARPGTMLVAPFQLVIVDTRGAVVFAGEVCENGRVRQPGVARLLRWSHLPATALLTDQSLVTRTFQIERAS